MYIISFISCSNHEVLGFVTTVSDLSLQPLYSCRPRTMSLVQFCAAQDVSACIVFRQLMRCCQLIHHPLRPHQNILLKIWEKIDGLVL